MSEVSFSNQPNNFDIKELSKHVSTAPSFLEKDFVEDTKDKFNVVKDSFSDSLKTTEGKAVATGIVVSTINPIISLGCILGGVGLAAMKFLQSSN